MNDLSRKSFLAGTGCALAAATARPVRANPQRRVRFGVNYVPTEHWWYSWADWRRDSIRRDLQDIAELGVDHIRIQLLWPQFQSNAAAVNDEAVSRLAQLLDDAGALNLDVQVTVLDGQLSGFLFVPAFLVDNQDGHIHNFITDAKLIRAQQLLLTGLAQRVASHPHFMGFDIANEVYWFTEPLKIRYTPQQGDAWMQELLTHCERIAPGKLHVNGVDKWPYEESSERAFSRRGLLRAGGASCVHPWPGFSPVYKQYGPLSTAATHYSEFFVQYMQAFSSDGKRRIWIEEDGCSKQWMNEQLIPQWAEASIRNAAGCDHLFGITWWCSHDVNQRYTGFNKLEYDLGLYTNDRRLKPLGRKFRELVREFDRVPPPVVARAAAIVIPDEMGANALLPIYMQHVSHGAGPQIVLASRAHDSEYLASRGITHVTKV